MIITAEISHYPLADEYEEDILQFIQFAKSQEGLIVVCNSMSTYIKGPHEAVMAVVSNGLIKIFEKGGISSTVLKLIPRDLPIEDGLLKF